MQGLYHPFSKALYERHGDNMIRVTDGDVSGVFTHEGEWVEGELRFCDPQLCGWVAGPLFANHRMSKSADDR